MKFNLDLDPWDINMTDVAFVYLNSLCIFGKQHDVFIDFYVSHSGIYFTS